MRSLRAYQEGSVEKIRAAVEGLRVARMNLQDAGALRAAAKVRLALRSAEGAFRHAVRLEYVAQQQEREETDRKFNRGFAIGLRSRSASGGQSSSAPDTRIPPR